MSMLSLSLYGSRAREDHSQDSDTDLFAITDDDSYKMLVNGKTNIACYPVDLALSRTASGDLFFMHIVMEAVPLYDPQEEFQRVKREFKFKENYQEEISNASELGHALLLNEESTSDFSLYNKRIIWCIRTILIARSAEEKRPKFSASDLSHHFSDQNIGKLISIKDSDQYERESYSLAKQIINRFGKPLNKDMPKKYTDLAFYFKDTGNFMGERTARLLSHDIESDQYGWF
ncbi:nucleotidyltransferase domain-containing protein [Pseudomonas aeruginosa]|uniref:anti-phage Hailong system nucleotidyltransferase HalB n=1 Tax=Pseudomonas aeruginosa TaxID=287 RepID=UPI003CE6E9A8